MDCVLMETSAYKELQAHLQRLLERVSALHSLSAQPTTVRWLTAEEVCKALRTFYKSSEQVPLLFNKFQIQFINEQLQCWITLYHLMEYLSL